MVDISKNTLEKLKKEDIHLKPRWYFLTKNYFFWLMFFITTVLGGISFGMILFATGDLDWDIYHYLGMSLPRAILVGLPYFWIALVMLFLFITYYNFVRTRTGYRYKFVVVFLISLLISSLLGIGFYQYGWTETVDTQLRQKIPSYHNFTYNREKQWMHPDKGLLSGHVVELKHDTKLLILKDYFNKEWNIDISKANIKGKLPITKGIEIRLLGQQITENNFKASEIRTGKGLPLRKGKKSIIKIEN